MASPVISHSKPRLSRPSRQRSVHGKSPSTVRIAMETTLVNRDTAVILQCKRESITDLIINITDLIINITDHYHTVSLLQYQIQ